MNAIANSNIPHIECGVIQPNVSTISFNRPYTTPPFVMITPKGFAGSSSQGYAEMVAFDYRSVSTTAITVQSFESTLRNYIAIGY